MAILLLRPKRLNRLWNGGARTHTPLSTPAACYAWSMRSQRPTLYAWRLRNLNTGSSDNGATNRMKNALRVEVHSVQKRYGVELKLRKTRWLRNHPHPRFQKIHSYSRKGKTSLHFLC